MTPTEKQIEEIIEKVRTVEFLHGVPVSLPSETIELLRSGIRGAIQQAIAEERERVRGEIEKEIAIHKELESQYVGGIEEIIAMQSLTHIPHGAKTANPHTFVIEQLHNLLSSLNTPLPE